MPLEQQRPPDKIGNIVFERHVYEGPSGFGLIDYQYRIQPTDKLMQSANHIGPENRASHGFVEILDVTRNVRTQTGTIPVLMDVVKFVESIPGSGNFDLRIIVQETHNQPVFTDVPTIVKHPYKARFFGL